MNKDELSTIIKTWLESFLMKKFGETHDVLEIEIPDGFLSKYTSKNIKSLKNHSSWDFSPDVYALIKDKKTKNTELILLNRSTSPISLKEIGEINIYTRLSGAKMAFIVSSSGISNEVNLLLLDQKIQSRLLNHGGEFPISVFKINEENGHIVENSIMPMEMKEFLLN